MAVFSCVLMALFSALTGFMKTVAQNNPIAVSTQLALVNI